LGWQNGRYYVEQAKVNTNMANTLLLKTWIHGFLFINWAHKSLKLLAPLLSTELVVCVPTIPVLGLVIVEANKKMHSNAVVRLINAL
jgi:hypothetical protein